jgi:SMI1 / KNR4 family (SUKH-1)
LQREAPEILKSLYSRPDQVLRSHFSLCRPGTEESYWLDLFLPMDEEALEPYGLRLPPGAVAFADDEHGDPYFFVPEPTSMGDGPVYVLRHHEGADAVRPVAPALSDFLSWPMKHSY